MKLLFSLLAMIMAGMSSGQTIFPVTTVSFKFVRNLMVVDAMVNGKEGKFILDTGVSEVALNERFFSGMATGEKFSGLNGIRSAREMKFINLEMEGWSKKTMAIVTNLRALEQVLGFSLTGVIGNDFFRNCEVVFDYVSEEISIYQLDKKGNRLVSEETPASPLWIFNFFHSARTPYLDVTLDNRRLKMGLDSGASVNVIDRRVVERMPHLFSSIAHDSLTSFGADETVASSLLMNSLQVGDITCTPMKTLLLDFDHLNQNRLGIKLDGLLGYPFLRNFRVGINFRKWEICLWDHQMVETPLLAINKTDGMNRDAPAGTLPPK